MRFKYQFMTNLLPSLLMKEFWKSVSSWQSYWQEYSGTLFPDSAIMLNRTKATIVGAK